ncbi:hypothetical protein KIN20_001893 [Parelaphostrongylus tenuis]|uniref:G-protein coupled receptors family 1 profile domain-containing protein n=1 Tax=Parelaphostrongylus tenuis TaxID=148309 RepID=A0AAD5LXN3_PARTN|nr:hypothetical protein KIN20_001893 [Parelaphostrongylus tenuis]
MNRSNWSVSVSAYLEETPPLDVVMTTPFTDAIAATTTTVDTPVTFTTTTIATTFTSTSTTAAAALSLAEQMLNAMTTAMTMTSPIQKSDDDIRVILLNNSRLPTVSIENVTIEETCRFRGTIENYVVIFTFITIFLLSVIGNALVIVVIMQQRAMRSITNIYLMNLAITDLMLSVVCMPPTLFSMVMNCWIFGNILCKVFAYLQPMVVTASAYTLAVIAFERYFAICRPLHSRIWQTRSHAYAMIMLVWVIALAANVLMLFMYEEQTYNGNGLTCAPIYKPVYHFANQVYMTIVLLAVPLVIMTVLYGSVYSYFEGRNTTRNSRYRSFGSRYTDDQIDVHRQKSLFRKLTKKIRQDSRKNSVLTREDTVFKKSDAVPMENSLRSTHIQKSAIAKQRVIRMLIVVVIIFFCCWTPSYIWWLLLMAGDSFESLELNLWNSDVNTFITLLTYISSCANPITYCFLNKKFRTAIYSMSVSSTFNPQHHVDFNGHIKRSMSQARDAYFALA